MYRMTVGISYGDGTTESKTFEGKNNEDILTQIGKHVDEKKSSVLSISFLKGYRGL